jgi:hypothetical protein
MKKILAFLIVLIVVNQSCKTVYSTTSIEPKKSFVLGDNEHSAFEITIKNISEDNVALYRKPNGGTKEFIQFLNSNKSATLVIEENTALYVQNESDKKVSVELKLKSTSNLSMGYKD